MKYTEPGGSITVECEAADAVVQIHVHDTGIGIPADRLPLIFEPFVQLNRRLSRPLEGVGLGLAISRDLARGMNGDLTAVSTVGKGSTFTLTLPQAIEARAGARGSATGEGRVREREVPEGRPGANRRALQSADS